MIDWNMVLNASASIGGFALVGKWLVRSVEKSNETLPVMVKNLETLNESVKELFISRNRHEVEIVEIRTGIEYCESCNAHRIPRNGKGRRSDDKK